MPNRLPRHRATPKAKPPEGRQDYRAAEAVLRDVMGAQDKDHGSETRATGGDGRTEAPTAPGPAHGSDRDRGTASQRGYGASWRKLRAWFLRRHPLCAACEAKGRLTAATVVDHVLPRRFGGTDHPRNLQPLCATCHNAKTAREMGRKKASVTGH